MRRWRFDEAGWAGARAVLELPEDVVASLPPVPAPSTAGRQPPAPTDEVLATLEPLRATLAVVALGEVTVELVQHRGQRAHRTSARSWTPRSGPRRWSAPTRAWRRAPWPMSSANSWP